MITNHSEEFWKLLPSFRLCVFIFLLVILSKVIV